jgi:hypothetical protein
LFLIVYRTYTLGLYSQQRSELVIDRVGYFWGTHHKRNRIGCT